MGGGDLNMYVPSSLYCNKADRLGKNPGTQYSSSIKSESGKPKSPPMKKRRN
jgi:hypothetical protein